jgi:transcriptional regulator GlxA family with amidase domain
MERPASVIQQPLAGAHFARLLMTTLLFAHSHNHSEALHRPVSRVRPRAVRQVLDLVEAHPEEPYSAGALAAHAGVSLRALQAGFSREVGMSPMAYLQDVRLARVHGELVDAITEEATTTEIAYRWGFTHLGRFSAAYRRKYGVAPSETLRRCR